MRPVKIITDSCSDLIKELRDRYDIDYARMKTVCEGEEQWASLDFETVSAKELYDTMRSGKRITTTQVPPMEFERIFTKYLDEGYDIIYIACASKQSSSVFTGEKVAESMREKYPDAQIFCIDPYNASVGEALLAVHAAKYRDQGMSAKEITDKILSERNNVNEFFTVQTLTYMKRAGRVSASKAFFGNLMGVKPILVADVSGIQMPIAKAKGRQKSLDMIVELLKGTVSDPEEDVFIAHADAKPEEVEYLRSKVEKEIPCKNIYVGYMGPIIGASVGPEAIGVWGFGKERTYKYEG